MPRTKMIPHMRAAYRGQQFETPQQVIPKLLLPEAILNPPLKWWGTTRLSHPAADQFVEYHYPAEGCSEVHMIWSDSPCWIACWNDGNRAIEAYRSPKIEFILAQHPWLENDCLFADVILPANTKLEEEDINLDTLGGQYSIVFREDRCIEAVGESKSDYEIVCAIAERLGLLEALTAGKSVEDWIRFGYEKSAAAKEMSYDELVEKGYYVVPNDPDWESYPVGLAEFVRDPEAHPLQTPSGKIEFCSTNLMQHFPDDDERPPVPHWIPYGETHQESPEHPRARQFPLLLMSNHPRWRVHVSHDDVGWLREIPTCKVKGPDGYMYQPVWIHPSDAAQRGIEDGDIVKIFNERGAVLGGAYVTERIIPGAVSQDHGARYDPIVPGELDRGGSNNTIAPHNLTSRHATGMATSGFLVEVAKVNLEELRAQYPEAFARPYDAASGLVFDAWVEGGE